MIKSAKFTAYNISARTKTLALQDDGSRNSLATLLTRLKVRSNNECPLSGKGAFWV